MPYTVIIHLIRLVCSGVVYKAYVYVQQGGNLA